MSRYRVAIDLDEAALVGRCLAYVADPRPDCSRPRELFRLLAILGRYGLGPPAELLDALAVDGGTRREDVAAVISSWLAQATAGDEVAGGRPNAEIAEALGLSPHSVKRHVHRILTKLAPPSRAAAAAFALQTGVV